MASKKSASAIPLFLVTGLILLVVYSIVRRDGDSYFARSARLIGQMMEGFTTRTSIGAMCPKGWKFFNNDKGASFCCGANVNPYGATCSDPKKTCALEPNLKNDKGAAVPLCKT
jgi:hypothetical protein